MAAFAKLWVVSVLGVASANAWAEPSTAESLGHASQCRDTVRGVVLATLGTACLPERAAREHQGQKRQVLERDALLHFRAGSQRPRMIRAEASAAYSGFVG